MYLWEHDENNSMDDRTMDDRNDHPSARDSHSDLYEQEQSETRFILFAGNLSVHVGAGPTK